MKFSFRVERSVISCRPLPCFQAKIMKIRKERRGEERREGEMKRGRGQNRDKKMIARDSLEEEEES